jgi:hypothetical protein
MVETTVTRSINQDLVDATKETRKQQNREDGTDGSYARVMAERSFCVEENLPWIRSLQGIFQRRFYITAVKRNCSNKEKPLASLSFLPHISFTIHRNPHMLDGIA